MKLSHALKRKVPLQNYSWTVWAVELLFFFVITDNKKHPRVEITWANGILQHSKQTGENLEFKLLFSTAWPVSEDSNSSLIPCAS